MSLCMIINNYTYSECIDAFNLSRGRKWEKKRKRIRRERINTKREKMERRKNNVLKEQTGCGRVDSMDEHKS